jgi:hypothetical protein
MGLEVDTNILEKHTASSFKAKGSEDGGSKFFKMLVPAYKSTFKTSTFTLPLTISIHGAGHFFRSKICVTGQEILICYEI